MTILQLGGEIALQDEGTIERALHDRHAREFGARLALLAGDVQTADDDARFGQQQDREHYVKAAGDRNRVEPPACGSTRHVPVTARPGLTLGFGRVARRPPRDTVLRFRRTRPSPT